jgi:hypothetical protein
MKNHRLPVRDKVSGKMTKAKIQPFPTFFQLRAIPWKEAETILDGVNWVNPKPG